MMQIISYLFIKKKVYGFNCMTVIVRSAVNGPDSCLVLKCQHTNYHAADKYDTPPSHFKLTLGQPALL